MAGKKGQLPNHFEIKEFKHPGAEHPIIRVLHTVQDFRKPSLFSRHSLTNVLLWLW